METAQLYHSITFLAYATGVIVILVGGMLVWVLFDLSRLARNLNEVTKIVKTELTPTLQNINKTVEILSGIVIKTDAGINKVKDFITKSPLGFVTKIGSGFWSGLSTAFKIFSKKK